MKSISRGATDRGEIIPNTPLRMLIRSYPDLVENVLDRCIKKNTSTIEMNFEFIDDTFSINKTIDRKTGKTIFYHDELNDDNMSPYDLTGNLDDLVVDFIHVLQFFGFCKFLSFKTKQNQQN